jgi:YHS domain-containing protein
MISNEGRNIQLCLLPDKARIVVFNENVKMADSFYSKIAINKMDRNGMWTMDISDVKSHAGYPVLHAVGKNSVIVAWEDNDKLYYRIVDANAINKSVADIAETRQGYRPSLNAAKLAVNKDIVCGMPINKGVSDTAHYKGKIYGFCAAECKAEFVKSPELYFTAK